MVARKTYTRKTTSRRKFTSGRRKRTYRKKTYRQKIHYIKRSYNVVYSDINTALDDIRMIAPTLADLPGYTDFTNLYDQYCIKGVKVVLDPVFPDGTSTDISNPPLYTCLNYDGGLGNSIVFAQMQQYQSTKHTRFDLRHKRYFRPCVTHNLEYQLGPGFTGTSTENKFNTWISSTRTDVPHHGLSLCWPYSSLATGATTTALTYIGTITLYCAFKNVY